MQRRRGDEESHAGHRAGRDHRQDPERGERDVDERLEELAPEGLGQEAAQAQVLKLGPRLHLAVEVVDHESEQDQAQVSRDRGAGRGPDAQGFQPPQERQPKREADREEELRHDRVGIAAIRVVVLPDGPDRVEAAEEVHQQHAGHRVAAELVERGDAARQDWAGAHSGHAGAAVVAILELRFAFLFLHRQSDRPRECKRTGVATAARSTRSLISDHSVRVPGTARTQKSENFIPVHAVQVKSPSSRSTTSSPLGFWVLDL